MKNINIKKRLALKTETLRSLDNQQLSQVGDDAIGPVLALVGIDIGPPG